MLSKVVLQKSVVAFLFLLFSVGIIAEIPAGYYNTADKKTGAELKTAIYNIIKPHTQLEYYHLSYEFQTTDWNPDGYMWDMYSNYHRSTFSGMNREHSMPKSWFGIASGAENTAPIGTDLHNLYPADYDANMAKSNYPIGVVTGTPTFTNGVVKVGPSTSYSSNNYTGSAFEPADEYKGDFARDYMYMVTCYEDYANIWQSTGTLSMIKGGTYPVFRDAAISLLLKWHRQDQVSTKEINRNDAVYGFQHNRNPFIDHPELAEFIWGKYVGSPWDMNGSLPELNTPLKLKHNPVTSIIEVNLLHPTEATYYIQSISGVIYKTGNFDADGSTTVDEFRNGMYVLVVYSGSYRKVTKFVVQHKIP